MLFSAKSRRIVIATNLDILASIFFIRRHFQRRHRYSIRLGIEQFVPKKICKIRHGPVVLICRIDTNISDICVSNNHRHAADNILHSTLAKMESHLQGNCHQRHFNRISLNMKMVYRLKFHLRLFLIRVQWNACLNLFRLSHSWLTHRYIYKPEWGYITGLQYKTDNIHVGGNRN